MKQILLGTT
uniref:Uncharacterized protein n=1 Tax=Vitis vinifera TaxID=29760 RepID=F6HWW3_VITVI